MAGRGSPPGVRLGGRQKGTPNRITKQKRLFMQDFIDQNYELAKQLWLEVAQTDKRMALKLYLDAAEFAYPKLGRTEVVGDGGGAVVIEVKKYTEA